MANPFPETARARLLLLADSGFPSGAFAHSWGLEWAVRAGWVTDAASLHGWSVEALRFGVAPLAGQAVARAAAVSATRGDPPVQQLIRLSDQVASFLPSREARAASSQIGRSLLRAAADALPALRRDAVYAAVAKAAGGHDERLQHPVAWGFLGGSVGIDTGALLQAYLLGTVRQWSQAAMRTIPLGQAEAVGVVGALLDDVTELALAIDDRPRPLASVTLGWDVALLGHGELSARYFRS